MDWGALKGRRILVAEDEYFLMADMADVLEEAGALVAGPVASLDDAMAIIADGSPLDGAILDINLKGIMSFPLADKLIERGVPFVFLSGYDAGVLPERYADAAFIGKPASLDDVVRALASAA